MTILIEEFHLLVEIQKFLNAEGSRLELSSALCKVLQRMDAERELALSKLRQLYDPSGNMKKTANEKPLMQQLLDAGYPAAEMDHHESDLYVYVTPLTTQVITRWCRRHGYDRTWCCPMFFDNITGRAMYDCAFQWIGGVIDDV